MLVLCWCDVLRAGESTAASAVRAIDAIVLERGCFGCDDAFVLELRRDGQATLTRPGNLRMGQPERILRGRIDGAAFERLASLAGSRALAALKEDYDDPSSRDGAWTSTRLRSVAGEKRVFARDDAAPAELRALQAAIEQEQRGIDFQP